MFAFGKTLCYPTKSVKSSHHSKSSPVLSPQPLTSRGGDGLV